MKSTVKFPVLITICLSLTFLSNAQLRLPAINGIGPDIKKVISDYSNHFSNLTGELIIQNAQSADYECNFKVTGAEQATVTKFSSGKKNISSWQALMLTTENFDDAKKKFKALFSQLNNLAVKPNASASGKLRGVYINPVEEHVFTSVLFAFDDADDNLKKLKVEIAMTYELMEWKVRVMVYEKERADDDRGTREDTER
jgi:hypothetical protein